MPLRTLPLIIVALSLSSASCVTMGKFNALKDKVSAFEKESAELKEQSETLETRIDNLNNVTKEDRDAIRTRLAELAADFKDLQMEIGKAQGRQEEIDFKLNEIAKHVKGLKGLVEDRFGTDSDALPKDLPSEPEKLFEVGMSAYKTGLTRKARAIFREFMKQNSDHALTDDAQLMIGETLFAEGRFTESVNAYKTVYDQYQTGDRYKEAVLKIGLAYVRSNRCKKALKIYKFAAKTFKGTEEADAAKKEVKELKKVCK